MIRSGRNMRLRTSDLQPEDQRLIGRHVVALEVDNRARKTIKEREGVLRRLSFWLESNTDNSLGSAKQADLRWWCETLLTLPCGRPAAVETRRAYVCHMRAFYSWQAEFTGYNPAERLRPPHVPVRRGPAITETDLRTALRGLIEPVRTWVALAAFAGLRAAEVAAINGSDFDTSETPIMLLVRGKGSKDRTVPVIDPLWRLCQRHISGPGSLWARPLGGRIDPQWVSTTTADSLRALGINRTLHSARHRLGRRLYLQTLDIRMVQEILGHASIRTTQIYTEGGNPASPGALAKLAGPLDGLI